MPASYRARAALLAVAAVLLAGCGSDDGGGGGATSAQTPPPAGTATTATTAAEGPDLGPALSHMTALPGALKSAPPWPANNGPTLQLRLREIGFEPLRAEGQVVHIHQHLDLSVDGKQVTVPESIGIDANNAFISDLHTHDSSGLLHVESPTQRAFTLGEFFAVWGLPLSHRCIGSLCEKGARKLRVWVDGSAFDEDPTRIVLADHQEIAIAFGTAAQAPDPVPESYDFAAAGV